ncbi:hypothetical protein AURANDRAFT_68995, partial [Aureococcus anophagefferens]
MKADGRLKVSVDGHASKAEDPAVADARAAAVAAKLEELGVDPARLRHEGHGAATAARREVQFTVIQELRVSDTVQFAACSSDVTDGSAGVLDAVARVLAERPHLVVRVEGHCCTSPMWGSTTIEELAADRAEAVVAALAARGVPRDQLRPRGFGADLPVDVANKRLNRRTEFHVVDTDVEKNLRRRVREPAARRRTAEDFAEDPAALARLRGLAAQPAGLPMRVRWAAARLLLAARADWRAERVLWLLLAPGAKRPPLNPDVIRAIGSWCYVLGAFDARTSAKAPSKAPSKPFDDFKQRYLPEFAWRRRKDRDGPQKTFLLKHLGEDTVKGCSVFHGADAFLTGHAAFTLELEQALQAVDASVSAPYWDTSLDDDARGAAWAEGLELFAEDWFGARAGAGGPKLDYPALTTGRFAYVDVPSYAAGDAAGAAAAPPERNAFGRLTQSYNNDPATFLWRSDSVCGLPSKLRLPGCAALKGALREASVSDLRAKIETDWHGALHPTLGGAFDCASESAGASHFAALAKTAPELVQFVHQLAEVLWDVAHNTGHLKCPSSCDEAAGFAACRCACPALDAEFAAGNAALAYAFLDSIGLLSRYAGSQRGDVFVRTVDEKFCFAGEPNGACLAGRDADDFFVALARLSCAPGRVAPYMTPLAASNDPLFW